MKTIVVLYSNDTPDQLTPDNQDTLLQLAEITEILQSSGYKVAPIAFHHQFEQLASTIREVNPYCIFNLVETLNNENKLQYFAAAFIEYLGYPYTGCPAWSLAALASKISAKQILLQAGLPTPDFWQISEGNYQDFVANNGKWIIKPTTEHASFGINQQSIIDLDSFKNGAKNFASCVENDLYAVWHSKLDTAYGWFVERFVVGREFNVSILDQGNGQPHVVQPVEMTLGGEQPIGNRILDYDAKWYPESKDYDLYQHKYNYSPQDKELIANLKSISARCWQLFGLKGAARIDFRVDNTNKAWVVDINANPCLASDAGLMVAAQQFEGLAQKDVILKLIAATLASFKEKPCLDM